MKKSLRIIHIVTRLNVGGISRTVIESSDGLIKEGHRCVIVSGVLPGNEQDMFYLARKRKVPVIYLPSLHRGLSFKDFCAIWHLYQIFIRYEPDIIHTHASKAGAIGRIAGMIYRIF